MSENLRAQIHRLIDELSPHDLLTVRMLLEDLRPGDGGRSKARPKPRPFNPFADDEAESPKRAKRLSVAEYRRSMGLADPE